MASDTGARVRVIRLRVNEQKKQLEVLFSYSQDGGASWAPELWTNLEGTFYSTKKLEAQIRRAHGLDASFHLAPHYWRGLISRGDKDRAVWVWEAQAAAGLEKGEAGEV